MSRLFLHWDYSDWERRVGLKKKGSQKEEVVLGRWKCRLCLQKREVDEDPGDQGIGCKCMPGNAQGSQPLMPRMGDCEQQHNMNWHDSLRNLPRAAVTSIWGRKHKTSEYSFGRNQGRELLGLWAKQKLDSHWFLNKPNMQIYYGLSFTLSLLWQKKKKIFFVIYFWKWLFISARWKINCTHNFAENVMLQEWPSPSCLLSGKIVDLTGRDSGIEL